MEFANGIWFNRKDNAPDFVFGSISISKEKFQTWLESQDVDEKGYVKLSILKSKKDGKPYITLDTWKPKKSGMEDIEKMMEDPF